MSQALQESKLPFLHLLSILLFHNCKLLRADFPELTRKLSNWPLSKLSIRMLPISSLHFLRHWICTYSNSIDRLIKGETR